MSFWVTNDSLTVVVKVRIGTEWVFEECAGRFTPEALFVFSLVGQGAKGSGAYIGVRYVTHSGSSSSILPAKLRSFPHSGQEPRGRCYDTVEIFQLSGRIVGALFS